MMKRFKITNVARTLAIAATATAGILTSCTDYSEFTEAELKHQEDLKSYTEMFEAMFGKMDPNHDWGMNTPMEPLALGGPGTRAGDVNTNRNQWTQFTDDATKKREVEFPNYGTGAPTVKVPIYKANDVNVIGHDIQIPGFPHLNGLYYTATGNTQSASMTGDEIQSQAIPAGDITPYEIQYVSNWFRTHPNPESISLHLTDFFIQNVSCDFDQVEYDRTGKYGLYQTGWESTGKNGRNIESVTDATNHLVAPGGKYTGPYVENLVEKISYDLDYLGFEDHQHNWTHVNNFNRGNSNFSPEDNASNPNREIKYVKSAGTENFTARSSWSTSNNTASKWVLVHLKWNETVKDPKSPYSVEKCGHETIIPREGYYLAFDFAGEKEGQNGSKQIVHPDGYYSNWIVKITPAHFNPTGRAMRVMVEDLGGALDYDFNDVVFDVGYEGYEGNYTAVIAVQATGATMPIQIMNETDDFYEVHNLLGKNEMKQINVDDTKFETHAPAIFRYGPFDDNVAANIKLWVKNTREGGHVYPVFDDDSEDADDNRHNLDGSTYKTKNIAPRAFAVPNTNVKWMKEYNCIDNGYDHFVDWVGDKTWMKTDITPNVPWYNLIASGGANLLYTARTTAYDGPTNTGGSSDANIVWTPIIPDVADDAASVAMSVKADSYMRLEGYTGDDPIATTLRPKSDDSRVTFTVIVSSNTQLGDDLKAVILPADKNTGDDASTKPLVYKGAAFALSSVERFNTAAYVPNPPKNFGDSYVYTLQFSFSKADLIKSGTTFHDWLFFYLKVGNSNIGTNENLGANHGVTVREWYVHY